MNNITSRLMNTYEIIMEKLWKTDSPIYLSVNRTADWKNKWSKQTSNWTTVEGTRSTNHKQPSDLTLLWIMAAHFHWGRITEAKQPQDFAYMSVRPDVENPFVCVWSMEKLQSRLKNAWCHKHVWCLSVLQQAL